MDILRGDIFFIAPGENDCFDLKGGRPAIIVSNNMGNQHSNYIEVVYLTTKDKKPLPTHVEVVCRQKALALCEQVTTIHKNRVSDFIKTCTAEEMKQIDEALMVSLGLGKTEAPKYEPSNEFRIGFHAEASEETIPAVKMERDLYKKLYEQLLDKITR